MTARDLLARLAPLYPSEGWWPSASPFETAIGAILVQGVAWRGAANAVAGLRDAGLLSAAALAAADPSQISEAIRPALYHHQKSGYLQSFATFALSIGAVERLAGMPPKQQMEALLGVRGIGPETAQAIIVYALGGAEPVVDAYARRLFVRTGASPNSTPAAVEEAMRTAIGVDPARARALHAAVVEHARTVCRRAPRCSACPLAMGCPKTLGETGVGRGWRVVSRAGSAAEEGEAGDG